MNHKLLFKVVIVYMLVGGIPGSRPGDPRRGGILPHKILLCRCVFSVLFIYFNLKVDFYIPCSTIAAKINK